MTQKADGMNYAPKGKPNPVVKPGEFIFAAAHLDPSLRSLRILGPRPHHSRPVIANDAQLAQPAGSPMVVLRFRGLGLGLRLAGGAGACNASAEPCQRRKAPGGAQGRRVQQSQCHC